MEFDPSDNAQRRFRGYGSLPLPSPLDEEVHLFIARVREGGPAGIERAMRSLTERGRRVLRAYAERMASLAVRISDRDLVLRALMAAVIGGLASNSHEAMLVMPIIEDSAKRVGEDPAALFEEAARIVGHPGTVALAAWLGRSPELRALRAMSWVEGEDEEGFRYQLLW